MKNRIKIAAPIVYMLMILAVSSIPGDTTVESAIDLGGLPSMLQNALHIPLYAGLSILWLWSLQSNLQTFQRRAWTAAAVSILFAAVDEIYQLTIPGRTGSFEDVFLDVVGVAVAIPIYSQIGKKKKVTI